MKKQNTDKLTDKAFLRLILTSFLAIGICLVCLCSTTWAWFSEDVSSQKNALRSSSCLLNVAVAEDGTIVKDADTETVTLKQGVVYTFTLSLPKYSSSGYCIIVAGENKYYSEYLTAHKNEEAKIVSFYVTVESDREVFFKVRWGIYSGTCDVQRDTTLMIR